MVGLLPLYPAKGNPWFCKSLCEWWLPQRMHLLTQTSDNRQSIIYRFCTLWSSIAQNCVLTNPGKQYWNYRYICYSRKVIFLQIPQLWTWSYLHFLSLWENAYVLVYVYTHTYAAYTSVNINDTIPLKIKTSSDIDTRLKIWYQCDIINYADYIWFSIIVSLISLPAFLSFAA